MNEFDILFIVMFALTVIVFIVIINDYEKKIAAIKDELECYEISTDHLTHKFETLCSVVHELEDNTNEDREATQELFKDINECLDYIANIAKDWFIINKKLENRIEDVEVATDMIDDSIDDLYEYAEDIEDTVSVLKDRANEMECDIGCLFNTTEGILCTAEKYLEAGAKIVDCRINKRREDNIKKAIDTKEVKTKKK